MVVVPGVISVVGVENIGLVIAGQLDLVLHLWH